MHLIKVFWLLIGFTVAAANPAQACIGRMTLYDEIRHLDATAIVAVEITESRYLPKSHPNISPWQAEGLMIRNMLSEVGIQEFSISRSDECCICEDGLPAPDVGDTWVLYLVEAESTLQVRLSVPLEMAVANDARLEPWAVADGE